MPRLFGIPQVSGPRGLPEPRLVLAALAAVQWIAVGALVLAVRHNGWLFYQGGDQTFSYTSAWAIAGGHIPEASTGYGWPYLLAPIAGAVGPSLLAALPSLVLVQTVVLLPLALFCVYAIATRIGGRVVGYTVAAVAVAAPFSAIPLWDESYHAKYVEQFLPQAFGLTGLADFPSMVCLLVAGLFCLRALDTAAPADALLAGVAAGFAIGIKPANALFLAGPALAFLAGRRAREALGFGLGLLPSLLVLALWKYRGLGYLPLFESEPSALAAGTVEAFPAPAFGRYLELDWARLRENYVDLRALLWGVPLWQSLPLVGFAAVARRSWPKALLLGGWFASFALVKGSSTQASLDEGTLLRLVLPGIPPLLILAALAPFVFARRAAAPVEAAGVGRGPAAAAAVAFVALPLLLFAALSPLRDPAAVKYFEENVAVPVDPAFTVEVRRESARTLVSWRAPPTAGVRVFYRVFRSRPLAPAPDPELPPGRHGIRCRHRRLGAPAGAVDCNLEMPAVGTTRSHRFVDVPPPGPWVYRVGLAANWRDDPRAGDLLLLSPPGRLSAAQPRG